MQMHNCTLVVE